MYDDNELHIVSTFSDSKYVPASGVKYFIHFYISKFTRSIENT